MHKDARVRYKIKKICSVLLILCLDACSELRIILLPVGWDVKRDCWKSDVRNGVKYWGGWLYSNRMLKPAGGVLSGLVISFCEFCEYVLKAEG